VELGTKEWFYGGEMMLATLKKFFSGKADCTVETYGKLPCYKDYISVIFTTGAAQWRTWLLESFQGKSMPPEGVWPFIYQYRKNADLVIGLIQASSDGLREFPFTLFVVCSRGSKRGGLCSRSLAVSIWQELESLRQQLIDAKDIQDFYTRLSGKRISLSGKNINNTGLEDQDFSCTWQGDWPQMLVVGTRDARMLHLVRAGGMTNEEFVQNWQRLIVNH
jgi:hypothetical protein